MIANSIVIIPSPASSLVGIICSGGNWNPCEPVSRNSSVYEYGIDAAPYAQSSPAPAAASKKKLRQI